jgi:hypothetical protein
VKTVSHIFQLFLLINSINLKLFYGTQTHTYRKLMDIRERNKANESTNSQNGKSFENRDRKRNQNIDKDRVKFCFNLNTY